MANYQHNERCRVCNGTRLTLVLDLGASPPANAFLPAHALTDTEESFPLALYFCEDCTLAQLLDVVDPEILFKGYRYLTGANAPQLKHFEKYALEVIRPLLNGPDDLVIDIGGNDGVLLSYIKDYARVLNCDPADNLAALSQERGVEFYSAFFSSDVARDLLAKYGPARVVVANNVFAHTDPIRDVFRGVERLLDKDGVFVFEVHWAGHLVETNCFDQIYHEHLCFYSLHAARHLVEASGMTVFRADLVPSQGLSLRIFVARDRQAEDSVEALLQRERAMGLTDISAYEGFAQRVHDNRARVLQLLAEFKAAGKRIAGYGAPAKGNTLLNFYGIGPETLDYLSDTTPLKQGLFSPGMHIPVVAPEIMRQDPPDVIFVLAWNYFDAILEAEQELRAAGVKFLVTVPEIRIV